MYNKDMIIKNNLKQILDNRKITAYKMARDLHIPNQQVYQTFIKPDYVPSLRNAYRIAEYLGLAVDDIWRIN